MPAADKRAWLANVVPASINKSACCVKSAPADSTSVTKGKRWRAAISCKRRVRLTPIAVIMPPLMAELYT